MHMYLLIHAASLFSFFYPLASPLSLLFPFSWRRWRWWWSICSSLCRCLSLCIFLWRFYYTWLSLSQALSLFLSPSVSALSRPRVWLWPCLCCYGFANTAISWLLVVSTVRDSYTRRMTNPSNDDGISLMPSIVSICIRFWWFLCHFEALEMRFKMTPKSSKSDAYWCHRRNQTNSIVIRRICHSTGKWLHETASKII